jgi:hypothetical protein
MQTQEPPMSFTAGVIAILIFSVGYYFVVGFFSSSGQSSERSESSKLVYVCTYSQLEIKKQLKYSDSVKFQSCVSTSTSIKKSGQDYQFSSYLEAKNDFGMMIPQKYVCLLTLKNTKDLEYISCSFN